MSSMGTGLSTHASRIALAVVVLLATMATAQTYTKIYTWPEDTRNDTGIGLAGIMTQGQDGNLYGTIGDDNANAAGSAFQMTTAGKFTRIYAFCALTACADGSGPWGGLNLGKDGNLYGTTSYRGAVGSGTAFKLTPTGTLVTLWNFDNKTDGGAPWYPLLQGADGNFYAASSTVYAGDYGAFSKITATGTQKTLVDFNYTNGNNPNLPTQGTDAIFYGTALSGGSKGLGVAYKITAAGKITVLHNFVGYPTDGTNPIGVLTQGNDGAFYGVTYAGGAKNLGSVFKITSTGVLTILHSFAGYPADGTYPRSGLILGSDGNFYGTTSRGGKTNNGMLYRITPAGVLTILYSLCAQANCTDGFGTSTPLMQHTNGKFYGSTSGNSLGGSYLYSLNAGLTPFTRLVTRSGKVGTVVGFLGQGFTTVNSVSFNGVAATFKFVSDTYITATVPAGALTGTVTVKSPTATLKSDRIFLVTPQVKSIAPATGPVGTKVTITGVSLKQTSKVTIGGKAATFTVVSDTQVTATVATGAKTGAVAVTTAGGSANSPTKFTVTP